MEVDMTARPEDWAIAMWKQQIGRNLRLLEAMADQSRKLRERQLAAAVETHASAVATRESLAKVTEAAELWRLQSEWLSASLQAWAAYWRLLYEVAAETQGVLATCACEPVAATTPEAPPANLALLGMMDEAYKRWAETAQQFYAVPAPPRKAA
jgi:hypothetical protein